MALPLKRHHYKLEQFVPVLMTEADSVHLQAYLKFVFVTNQKRNRRTGLIHLKNPDSELDQSEPKRKMTTWKRNNKRIEKI